MNLFENLEDYENNEWEKEWQDMPEFNQKDLTAYQSIIVHFETKEDRENFAKLINQKLNIKTKFIWYPEIKIVSYKDTRYISES
jgi:hypothetical protein